MTGFEESLKALAMKMTGASALDVPGDMEGIIQYMADNLPESGGTGEAVSVDTLGGATEIGKTVMKAADAGAARTAIGAGTPYSLPAATVSKNGGVKQAATVTFNVDGATTETCATAIQALIDAFKASGAMA